MMQGVRGKARGSGQHVRERNGQRKRARVKQRSREARGTGHVSRERREVELLETGRQYPQPRKGAT